MYATLFYAVLSLSWATLSHTQRRGLACLLSVILVTNSRRWLSCLCRHDDWTLSERCTVLERILLYRTAWYRALMMSSRMYHSFRRVMRPHSLTVILWLPSTQIFLKLSQPLPPSLPFRYHAEDWGLCLRVSVAGCSAVRCGAVQYSVVLWGPLLHDNIPFFVQLTVHLKGGMERWGKGRKS
jgi:hypothetical protein